MATLELKDEEITQLNRSLATANARAAQLLAQRKDQLAALQKLTAQLGDDVRIRRQAENDLAAAAVALEQANLGLERLATLDALTEILNRRGLEKQLAAEVNRAQGSGHQVARVLADVDDFKHYNDALGHAGGDLILREVARRIRCSVRISDYPGRMGGDEFFIILPKIDAAGMTVAAERIRNRVCCDPVIPSDVGLYCSVSVAAILLPAGVISIEGALLLLKDALRASKTSGKNRLTIGEDSGEISRSGEP